MIALGALSPIEEARAGIQSKIADFLSARSRLMGLMNNKNLQVQAEAKALYNLQVQLEDKLQNEINPRLAAVQNGAWDFSDIATFGGFAISITKQISDVNKLEAKGGGRVVSTFDITSLGIGIPALVMIGLVGGYLLSRR